MKKLIGHDIGSYTFNPSAKTIIFSGVSLTLDQLLIVTNVTSGSIIYNFANPSMTGSLVGSVLTLATDTTAMNGSDALQIYVDTPGTNDATYLFTGSVSVKGSGTAIDTTGYQSIIIQVDSDSSSLWNGTVMLEGSNDQSTGSWNELFMTSIDDFIISDTITEEGQYIIRASTKYIRYNVYSLQTGSIAFSIIGRTMSDGADAANRLAIALDQSSGVNLSVAVQNLNTDGQGGLILSDAPANKMATGVGAAASAGCPHPLFTLDTAGYESVALQLYGTWAGTITFQVSNDGANWFSVSGWNTNVPTAAVISSTTNGMFSIPCVGRWFRATQTAWTSGITQATAFLRLQPASPMLASPSMAANSTINVAQWSGSSIISTGVSGSVAIGGSATLGGLPGNINPVTIGGVSYISGSGIGGASVAGPQYPVQAVRRLSLDQFGNIILSGVPAASSFLNLPVAPVSDITQLEGQSAIEILNQILIELKISNQYYADLPWQLQHGDSYYNDAPEVFRNDPSFFKT